MMKYDLALAKEVLDDTLATIEPELEKIYIEAMDFDALREYTDKIAEEILRFANQQPSVDKF